MGKTLGMIALVSGVASIGSGCQTTPQGYNFGAGMVNQAVGSYISGQLDPKGTNVTVNNGNSFRVDDPYADVDCIVMKAYCKINDENVVTGYITRIRENDLFILSNKDGRTYNIEIKDVKQVIDN